jgi:hypothetical protein
MTGNGSVISRKTVAIAKMESKTMTAAETGMSFR